MDPGEPRAVLVTGVYGSGKTSVAEEIADLVEARDLPYGSSSWPGAIRDRSGLDRIKAELPMPLKVVRLTVSLPEIEERLRSSATTARRREDLPEAAAWLSASKGVGIEDLTVPNDRPIRQVATSIVDWLGWA